MRFNAPSFFAGVASVLAILMVGFGGGVMMSGVISDGTRQPNKIERQALAATETKETKPASAPVVLPPPAQAKAAAEPSPVQVPPRAAEAPPAEAAPQAASEQPKTADTANKPGDTQPAAPSLGPQRPVSLGQPAEQPPRAQDRSTGARAARHEQRRAERRERAERRRQEAMRREELRSAAQARSAPDDDDAPVVVRRGGPLLPFLRLFGDEGCDPQRC